MVKVGGGLQTTSHHFCSLELAMVGAFAPWKAADDKRSFFQRERQLGNTDEQTVPLRGSRDAVAGVGALLSPRGQLTGLQWQRGPSAVCTMTAFSELSIGTQTISQAQGHKERIFEISLLLPTARQPSDAMLRAVGAEAAWPGRQRGVVQGRKGSLVLLIDSELYCPRGTSEEISYRAMLTSLHSSERQTKSFF